jgi:hypothetical protein
MSTSAIFPAGGREKFLPAQPKQNLARKFRLHSYSGLQNVTTFLKNGAVIRCLPVLYVAGNSYDDLWHAI